MQLQVSSRNSSTNPDARSVNENWVMFKTSLATAVDTFIPWKMTKAKPSLPWVTKAIKRQMRKRDKLYSLATHSVSAIHEWASILNIKGQADVIQLDFSKALTKYPIQSFYIS